MRHAMVITTPVLLLLTVVVLIAFVLPAKYGWTNPVNPAGLYRIQGPGVTRFGWVDLSPSHVWQAEVPVRGFVVTRHGVWQATNDGRRVLADDGMGQQWLFALTPQGWVGTIPYLDGTLTLHRIQALPAEEKP